MRPPQFRELLEIADDGTFTMWRSVSMASELPSPIGRFAGHVAEVEQMELVVAAKRAADEGSQTRVVTPDSPVDRFGADGAGATLGIHDRGEGAWEVLAGLVRPLLKKLTASPVAAIALQVDDGATLVHQGTEPLRLDLSRLAVRADHWRGSDSAGRWTSPETDEGDVVASPGWQLSLPFEHGLDLRASDRLSVHVSFAAYDRDQLIPVSLQSP